MGGTPSLASRADVVPGRILGLLGTQGPTSRAAIARRLRLSPATVTQAIKELVANGSVRELSSVPSNGGRPATLLGLARRDAGAIGVKITADHLAIVDVSIAGEVLRSTTVPFDPSRPNAIEGFSAILRESVADHPGLLLGVGVGVPGSVDAQDNGVVTSSMIGWSQVPLGAVLRDALGVPVLIDNDVHAVAAAQLIYGAGREYDTYIVVTVGLGIGCAVVIDRSIYRGARGGAGEIGHVPVTLDGPICQCGATGCLEAYIGAPALVRDARREKVIGPRGTIQALQRAANRNDEYAAAAFRGAGSMLGRVLAGVVNTLDPQAIVLLGEGMAAWSHWQPGFDETFRPHLMVDRRQLPIIREDWADDHWALGAAALVMASPFDSDASGAQGGLVSARLQSLHVAAS